VFSSASSLTDKISATIFPFLVFYHTLLVKELEEPSVLCLGIKPLLKQVFEWFVFIIMTNSLSNKYCLYFFVANKISKISLS